MFTQIRYKSTHSIYFILSYFTTIALTIIFTAFCITKIINIQICLQQSISNITHIKECNRDIYIVGNICITNLAFVCINLISFLIMIAIVDTVKEYNAPRSIEEDEMQ